MQHEDMDLVFLLFINCLALATDIIIILHVLTLYIDCYSTVPQTVDNYVIGLVSVCRPTLLFNLIEEYISNGCSDYV